jgi:transposase
MTARNTPPANIWQTLRRVLNCNKQELAAHLGVNRHTLTRWEAATEAEGDSAGKAANEAAARLLQETLRAANSDVHAQWALNWSAIRSIAGKK